MRLLARYRFALFATMLASGLHLFSEDPKIPALTVKQIEDTTKTIKEKSLYPNAAVAARAQGGAIQVAAGFADKQGSDTTIGGQYQEKSDKTEQPNGTSLYGFRLQPGERIVISKTGESASKVAMRIVEPLQVNAMTPLIQRVNRTARPIRSKRVELENKLPEPFHMVLLVYGEVGYAYELTIARQSIKE